MKNYYFLALLSLLILSACKAQVKSTFLTKEAITDSTAKKSSIGLLNKATCRDHQFYIPDTNHLEQYPIRTIRVNFHFVNDLDSTKNFNGKEALTFAKVALKTANQKVAKNNKPWLPPNGNLPGLPKRYKYILSPRSDNPSDKGVYCHYDKNLYYFINKGRNKNSTSRSVIKKYAAQQDSILDIFLLPHHPDSIRSKTYKPHQAGITLGTDVKISGIFGGDKKAKPWALSGVINHEIGHVLGLSHAWGYDGCDDTPIHPNCWNVSDTPPCDTMASNNVMDYNAQQNAWTPCQIGTIHRNFANVRSKQRKLLIKTWCTLKEDKTIYIKKTTHWEGAKDVESHIVILDGARLEISCRVALPKGATITIYPNAQLILNDNARLHNDCGATWEGIEILELGKEKGEVLFVGAPAVENVVH